MGGSGSGRFLGIRKKELVDDCIQIDLRQISRLTERFTPGRSCSLRYKWISWQCEFGFEVREGKQQRFLVVHHPTLRGQPHTVIPLISRPAAFNGVHWYGQCPLERPDGGLCLRRSLILYRPFSVDSFGCRECHQLTYHSAQTAHRFDALDCEAKEAGVCVK